MTFRIDTIETTQTNGRLIDHHRTASDHVIRGDRPGGVS
jgi:hypothetical protein